jgi:hypothetical protein
MKEDEFIYSPSKKCKCMKTSKESADKLFELLDLDLVDGEVICLNKNNKVGRRYSDVLKKLKSEPKLRGVKKGTKRGKYRIKQNAIKCKQTIIAICQMCKREYSYNRIGKRFRKFCSNKCKQKHYRQQKILSKIKKSKSSF